MPEIKLEVGMTCKGCSGAVERILGKVDGVSKIDARIEEKVVIVTAEGVTGEQLVEKLSKWSEASGKYVRLAA